LVLDNLELKFAALRMDPCSFSLKLSITVTIKPESEEQAYGFALLCTLAYPGREEHRG